MNFFKSIFGSSEENNKKSLVWNPLNSMEQLDEIIEESRSVCAVIFKHSTRCGISRFALNNFEASYDIPEASAKLYFLDILAYRDISIAVAEKFDIVHESPQLLLIKGGKVVHNESHGQIDAREIAKFV
ncbi:bacillithiol system redox-active protein YtxJ [Galbibacter pacificus]|uniref:Bacillithiol system redox-active protein YtxJ n=1 Tax=Galbibacter pacificus TaxID=2996052 RepID=A0ABT6FPJ2_9FLAO|nr:bacillithiol system redox-active protein YtxJ [Galbibacter pacificus]MDG3582341.1 bacillithiol system redox-active protein YtxJ [Galbibacter pacificus]MDG3585183.1 bacillithiol system redox-active protein YtxJ [Galbibacter pacificus]